MSADPLPDQNNLLSEPKHTTWGDIPWQIWVVVTVLSVEGLLGNLPAILDKPAAATWFGAKCLFVAGLLNGWRWIFCLNLIIGIVHVLAFSTVAPFVAFLNLVLVLLVASSHRFYFPKAKQAPMPN